MVPFKQMRCKIRLEKSKLMYLVALYRESCVYFNVYLATKRKLEISDVWDRGTNIVSRELCVIKRPNYHEKSAIQIRHGKVVIDALSKACTERDSAAARQTQQKTEGPIRSVLADQLINQNLAEMPV